ncbi:MAG TPA: PorT family protein [Bacteroidetes bacterium]|nr:PorT family protein [Bacteroidota bacterium]
MRTFLISTIFLLSFCSAKSQVSLGIKTGVSSAKFRYFFDDEHKLDSDPIKKLEIGIFANIKLSNKFSFEPEINFLEKGGAVPDYPTSPPPSNHYRQIELAMPFKYEYPFGKIFVFAKAGPAYGHMINGRTYTAASRWVKAKFDNSVLKRPDLVFMFGGGIGMSLGKSKISIESRYRQSILYTSDVELEDFRFSAKNKVFGIYLAYSRSFLKSSK